MSIWTWLGNIFHTVKVKIAPAIVSILNIVQGLEKVGIVDGVAKVVDTAFKTKLAEDANALVKANILTQIALWTGVAKLSADSTEADIKAFDDAVLAAVLSKKAAQSIPGQVASDLGAQIFQIVKTTIGDAQVHETSVTAADIIADIEEAYQDLLADIAAANAAAAEETN